MKSLNVENNFSLSEINVNRSNALYLIRNYEIRERLYHLLIKSKLDKDVDELFIYGSSIDLNSIYSKDIDIGILVNNKTNLLKIEQKYQTYISETESDISEFIKRFHLIRFDIHAFTKDMINFNYEEIKTCSKPPLIFIGIQHPDIKRIKNRFEHMMKNVEFIMEISKEKLGGYQSLIYDYLMMIYVDFKTILVQMYKSNGFIIPYFDEDLIDLSKKFLPSYIIKIGNELLKYKLDQVSYDSDEWQSQKKLINGGINLINSKEFLKTVEFIKNYISQMAFNSAH